MGSWQLQDAKARLSQVIATAISEGPQIITQRGVSTVVIVPFDEWQRAHAKDSPKRDRRSTATLTRDERAKTESLLKLLQSGPDFELPDRRQMRMRKPFRF